MNDVVPRVRRAVPADRASLLELWWQLATEGEQADPRYRIRGDAQGAARSVVDDWFSLATPTCVWVAETDRVVGFVAARPAEPHPVLDRPATLALTDLVVDPSVRRRGVGRLLVEAVRDDAELQGAGAIEVGTLALDIRAVAFWRAMGFGEWRMTLESPVEADPPDQEDRT